MMMWASLKPEVRALAFEVLAGRFLKRTKAGAPRRNAETTDQQKLQVVRGDKAEEPSA